LDHRPGHLASLVSFRQKYPRLRVLVYTLKQCTYVLLTNLYPGLTLVTRKDLKNVIGTQGLDGRAILYISSYCSQQHSF
jgi:hypothetical protein